MTDPIVTTTYKSVRVKYTHYGTWNYYVSFAVSFGYRAVPSNDRNCKVVRIWLNSTLIYDAYANLGDDTFVFYPGTEDQPFYRGQMVLFLGNVHLADGEGVPSVTAEIVDDCTLGAVAGTVYVGRHLTPAWADYSTDTRRIVQAIDDPNSDKTMFRSILPRTNSDGGSEYIALPGVDLTVPVIFAPWLNYALMQDSGQKVLVNTLPGSLRIESRFGDTAIVPADYQNFPPTLFGIAQNAGKSYSAGTTFFLLSSNTDGGVWPYQVLYSVNGVLVYGAGVGRSWADEPVCMTRGLRAGSSISAAQALLWGVPPADATGDVLVAFDYAVRRVRVGVAGSAPLSRTEALAADPAPAHPNLAPSIDDVEIYSHLSGVGKIVRLYHYALPGALAEETDPIILLIETNAGTHTGFARKIAYDGTIIWDSGALDLDGVTDAQLRTVQTSADLTAGRLGVISYNTANTYSVIDLFTGDIETGTFSGVTIGAAEPAFWLSPKNTFYPMLTDNLNLHVGLPNDTPVPLDDAIHSLAIRAGYADADIVIAGLHTTTIQGYIVGSNTTLGDILDNLSAIYQFTYAEIGAKLYVTAIFSGDDFVSLITITEDDLAVLTEGAADDQQIINTVIADEANMPNVISGAYIDPNVGYQQNVQTVKRLSGSTQATKSVKFTVPVIVPGADMLMQLYRALYLVWVSKRSHSIRLPSAYLALIPTDGFTFTALGIEHRVTAVSVTINADFSVSLSATERAPKNRAPTVGTQAPIQPALRGPVAPIQALLLDLPDTSPAAEQPDSLNLGVALSGYAPGQWVSGRLDLATAANPSSWATRLNSANETPMGTVIAITGAASSAFETDYSTRIRFELGTIDIADLVDASYSDMLAGANLLAIGRDGRFELLQFANVTDNGDGTATIDTLFRGRFGTDPVVGMMEGGDYVVPYAGLKSITYPLADFLATTAYVYRGVMPGENPEDAAQNFIIPNGNSKRLPAPVQVEAYRITDESNVVDVRWRRRVRFGGELTDSTASIPADDGRTFSLDLYSADMTSLALRIASFTMTTADAFDHYRLTLDQMTAAGYATDATAMNVIIYQVDASVGRGWGSNIGSGIAITDIAFDGAVTIVGQMGKISGSIAGTD